MDQMNIDLALSILSLVLVTPLCIWLSLSDKKQAKILNPIKKPLNNRQDPKGIYDFEKES